MSVLVFVDHTQGVFKKKTFETINYAAETAKRLGTSVTAVALGSVPADELNQLGQYGAQKVLHVAEEKLNDFNAKAYTKALVTAAKEIDAKVIITSYNVTGKTIAGMIAMKLKAGLVSGAVDYPQVEHGFIVKKTVFSGKAFANVKINSDVKVISLVPNTFQVTKMEVATEVSELKVDFNDDDFGIKVTEVNKVTGEIPLAEAELVVSGGRGLK